jgi:hypothetical protein
MLFLAPKAGFSPGIGRGIFSADRTNASICLRNMGYQQITPSKDENTVPCIESKTAKKKVVRGY